MSAPRFAPLVLAVAALADGGNVLPPFGHGFLWAPDASRVADPAARDGDGVQRLFAAAPDGSDPVELSGDLLPGGSVYSLQWRP